MIRTTGRAGSPCRVHIGTHAEPHLQECAHPDRRRRGGERRAAAASARAGGVRRWRAPRNPGDAARLHVKHRPDLILLDLHMPVMDGLAMDQPNEIAEASYPILMLTGDMTPEARQEALARGAKDFVSKPFHADEVLLRSGRCSRPASSISRSRARTRSSKPGAWDRTASSRPRRKRSWNGWRGRRVPRRQHRTAHRASRPDGGAAGAPVGLTDPQDLPDPPRRSCTTSARSACRIRSS